MNKREFLSGLREALSYDLPEQLVDSNLRYYSNYIDEEIRKGRGGEEVLSELGDPKLIARSIVDAIKSGADGIPGTADDVSFTETAKSEADGFSGASGACDTFDEAGNEACGDEVPRGGGARRGKAAPRSGFGGADGGNGGFGSFHSMQYQSGCFGCLIFVLLAFIVMSLIGTIVGGVLAILSPILGPLVLVLLIVWLLRRLDRR